MKKIAILGLALILLAVPVLADPDPGSSRGWPQWRGPLGTGVAPGGDPPTTWSEENNVRFKVALPGLGHSTPVIWGERIFLTTAVSTGEVMAQASEHVHGAHDNVPASRRQQLMVLALDRGDGSVLWERTVRTVLPHESMHETASWASASPVTDGKHVIASFGSAGVYGLDVDGELLWETDPGDMRVKHGHGEGSSPALRDGTVVVNWDHEGDSFVVALDARTGKQRWKVARDEGTSWSSPLIVEHAGKPQAIVAATGRVRSYDLATGKLVWECGGLSGNVVATPVAANGLVFVANSYETREMLAIRLAGARGDITGTDAVVWTRHRDTPYVPSPVLFDDALCFLKHYQGRITCVEPATGKTLFGPTRLPGIRNVYGSPVGAAGRTYVIDRSGATAVLQHAPEPQVLAVNSLDDSFSASPVVVGRDLYLRGERWLYRIAEDASP